MTTASYSGNQKTVTDSAGHSKTTTYDALGRLTSVTDATGTTDYTYNALGKLTKVVQGSQTRTFSYDMLGRLTQATNPESGTVSYAYDAAGNLTSRTDARGVTTTYTYDALNRPTVETYSDGTPTVTYSYDSGTNGKGHLTGYSNANAAVGFNSFDAMGHVLASSQITAAQDYTFAYGYNLAGALTSETYPSGRVLTISHDGADRVTGVSGILGSVQTTYASGVSYAPQGVPTFYAYGNGLTRAQSYNSRLQLSSYQNAIQNSQSSLLFVANLNWGTTNDNGNLLGETDYEGGPGPLSALTQFNRTYTYDAANRLTGATDSGGWSRSFGYDQYGNMWVTGASGVPLAGNTPTSNVYNAGNNRMNGGSYDAAGNQLVVNGDTLAYNAEDHMVSALDGVTHNTEGYIYDGAGQRVEKYGPSGTTVYVYDAFGQLAAEYSTVPQTPPCETCYLSYDQRGDVRMVTDASGNLVARHDYLPFGTEVLGGEAGRGRQWGSTTDVEQKFTGQIRDSETGIDYFHARYYGSALARFTSPDPGNAGANPLDPQSWNAYAYVGNNPLTLTDPSGMSEMYAVDCPDCTVNVVASDSGSDHFQLLQWLFGQGWLFSPLVPWQPPSSGGGGAPPSQPKNPTKPPATQNSAPTSQNSAPPAKSTPPIKQQQPTRKASTAVKTAIVVLQVATVISALFDDGLSLPALPAEEGLAGVADSMVTVTHFTSAETANAIVDGGGYLNAGSFVTLPGEVAGMNTGEVESFLEIGPGKGAFSTTFETPASNLSIPSNGSFTSGGATQFQLVNSTPVGPFFPTTP